jgi:hypothetical protein
MDSPEAVEIEICVDLDERSQRIGVHPLLPQESQTNDCTGFCTDPLYLALTGRYCSLRGGWRDVAEEKDKRFIVRNL